MHRDARYLLSCLCTHLVVHVTHGLCVNAPEKDAKSDITLPLTGDHQRNALENHDVLFRLLDLMRSQFICSFDL